MSGARFLLDGGVVASVLRHEGALVRWLGTVCPRDVAISTVTMAEMEFAVRMSREGGRDGSVLERLLGHVRVLPFGIEDAREYGRVLETLHWKGGKLNPHEVLLASQARRRGLVLMTGRMRGYREVPGLEVAGV